MNIKYTHNYRFTLWEDEDEQVKQISISPVYPSPDDIDTCFGQTNPETGILTICDHGLIPEQYLSKYQVGVIKSLGFKIGQEFKTPEEAWAIIEANEYIR